MSSPTVDDSLTPEKSSGTQDPTRSTDISLEGKRVVVVDDQGLIQTQISRLLQRLDMNVVGMAANGQEAVRIVLETSPDIVLMDISMPLMNGLEATRRILAQQSVCIVMLTGYSDEAYRQQAADLGAAGYLVKPIMSRTLLHSLQSAWGVWLAGRSVQRDRASE